MNEERKTYRRKKTAPKEQIIFLMIACNATYVFENNWRQAEAWLMLFVGAVEVNALAQGVLRRVTQWLWIEHPTWQLW